MRPPRVLPAAHFDRNERYAYFADRTLGSLRQGDPAGGNKCRNGLLYRLKAGEAGAVSKRLPTFFNGNAGTAHDMSPGGFGVAFL